MAAIMPAGAPVSRRKNTVTYNVGVLEITEELADVNNLLDRVMLAVSGPSLERWLRGEVTEFFHDDIESRFNEEGDPIVGFWPPLSEATIEIRNQLGFGPEPINRRTDQLFDFVMHDYPTHAAEDWALMDVPGDAPDGLTRTKLETAQQGRATNPMPNFGATPARPVLSPITDMNAARILEMLQVHIIHEVIESYI
jgi:hypothetical protein